MRKVELTRDNYNKYVRPLFKKSYDIFISRHPKVAYVLLDTNPESETHPIGLS